MEKDYSEKVCVCALNRLLGFEPRLAHDLIGAAGSARALFEMTPDEKLAAFGPYSKVAPLFDGRELSRTEEELDRLQDTGCSFITMTEPGYPALLCECDDAPLGLYYRGSSPPEKVFNVRQQIAVVGTRDISLYGKEWCRKIVGALATAKNKPLVVSGFAMGTDITAHLAALEAGLPTVAVLPTGIDDVYPSRHRSFAGKLAATEGCAIVTDYPPGTEPKAINFIRRNRIIAGICSGTILVESKAKGGGMITARFAASYDRDLMVLPGRADDPRSQGCNELLREKLAEPVTDTVHFLDVLGLGSPSRRRAAGFEEEVRARYGPVLPAEELEDLLTVAGIIRRRRGITLDEICPEACMPYGQVARYAGMLESDGLICTDLLQRCSINVKIV
jgi:DNA processing protein